MNRIVNLTLGEIFLIELICWFGLWLSSGYLATLLTLTIGPVLLGILLLAVIAEMIEPSKVPRRYFHVMLISLLAVILAAVLSISLLGVQTSILK
ncbi:MAG: hypothetical protein R3A50_03835 [Saprospiraceae bacterium]|nr:hypothetical protein [Lewinellaceae bacterium]